MSSYEQTDYDKKFQEDLEKAQALSLESLALEQFKQNKQRAESQSSSFLLLRNVAKPEGSAVPLKNTNLEKDGSKLVGAKGTQRPRPGAVERGIRGSGGSPSEAVAPGEVYFDVHTAYNVSAHIGKSAFLTCKVHNVGNLSVSWVRHRDIHILTVGAYTYTSDQRFMSLHEKDSTEWTLQIKWVQKRDAGIYECQVSTIPVKSLFVNLYVVVPSAVIHGRSDVHVEHGSTINLTCSINYGTEPPAYIFWYHHDKKGKVAVVNYDSERGGISVITVKAEVSTSHLVIRGAVESDAGKYYCSPSNADVAYVHVHVHSSKNPSAIQTGGGGPGAVAAHPTSLCLLHSFLLLLLTYISGHLEAVPAYLEGNSQ